LYPLAVQSETYSVQGNINYMTGADLMEALFSRIRGAVRSSSGPNNRPEKSAADKEREDIRREYERLARELGNTKESGEAPKELPKRS